MTFASPLAFLLAAAPLLAQSPESRSGPVFVDGMAQVVPAFQDSSSWIRQNLWVETDFDTDRDGRNDRVHVDVTRPAQTESEGLKVPVIYSSSPYFAGTARDLVFWDVKQEVGAESPQRGPMSGPPYRPDRMRISNALVNTWVPRGFAVVHSEAHGTIAGLSDCRRLRRARADEVRGGLAQWSRARVFDA